MGDDSTACPSAGGRHGAGAPCGVARSRHGAWATVGLDLFRDYFRWHGCYPKVPWFQTSGARSGIECRRICGWTLERVGFNGLRAKSPVFASENREFWMAACRVALKGNGCFLANSVTFFPLVAQTWALVIPMTCDELLAMLNEYVDGPVDPGVCQEFERHLAGCNPCQVVVDNIRKTITLYKEGQPYELPGTFRDRLHSELRAKWKEQAR